MSNSEKLLKYLKDNDINPIAILILIQILLKDLKD